ncbi:hypothetical protein C8R43DRAFT_1131916 [Mycena crocata]|nr:hypothetical protein C8R43DRAFT_1131916 [Mycena crocata]
MPHLTHFSIMTFSSRLLIPDFFKSCKSLQVLVMAGLEGTDFKDIHLKVHQLPEDTRFVLMPLLDRAEEWYRGACMGANYWLRAENFIAKRRSGQIPVSQFILEDEDH